MMLTLKIEIPKMKVLQFCCILITVLDIVMTGATENKPEWYTVDLLQHVDWTRTCSEHARTPALARDSAATAYKLSGDSSRCLEVENYFVRGHLREMLSETEELTVLATIKQEQNDTGSILAFTQNEKVLFELESSGARGEMRVHYMHDQRTHLQVFPVSLADNIWHQVALTFSRDFMNVFVDCQQVFERQVDEVDMSFLQEEDVELWVAQRSERHNHLQGALEYVKLVTTPQGYLEQCPYADVACPTCNQFKGLENTVSELYTFVQELNNKLLAAEQRLEAVESCECLQSCDVDGVIYRDGDSWNLDYCTKCTCQGGKVECAQPKCPVPHCTNPVLLDGQCCPICLQRCNMGGTYYEHGEGFHPEDRVCVDCKCRDGKMSCAHRTCPALDCPISEQIEIPGECCKVCKNTDFCAGGNNCHANATCINLATRFVCTCRQGFEGNGQQCTDIDECKTAGGYNGHRCEYGCENTEGTYHCTCPEGHVLDAYFKCKPFDACEDTEAKCGEHAQCINEMTSYRCECMPGYQGDGQTCTAECPRGCSNGGRCVAPGVCQCRKGYAGPTCQEDLDECALGLSHCYRNSDCVNMPGDYRCDCKAGYHSIEANNQRGYLCRDIDECRRGTHSCPVGSECSNTDGGYECICTDPRQCEQTCRIGYNTYQHGMIFTDPEDTCATCECANGEKKRCTRPECDCSDSRVDTRCCPQCRAEHSCRHQELPITYYGGDTWMYHCQTCTCVNGQRECSQLQCPALECSPAVQIEGDCCPRCMQETDACAVKQQDIRENEVCVVEGRSYSYGQHFKPKRIHDNCTTCTCKNGHVCCSYDQTCMQRRIESDRGGVNVVNRRRGLQIINADNDNRYTARWRDLNPEERRRIRKEQKSSRRSSRDEDYQMYNPRDTLHDTGQYRQNNNAYSNNNWQDYNLDRVVASGSRSKSSKSKSRHDRDKVRTRRDGITRGSRRDKT